MLVKKVDNVLCRRKYRIIIDGLKAFLVYIKHHGAPYTVHFTEIQNITVRIGNID